MASSVCILQDNFVHRMAFCALFLLAALPLTACRNCTGLSVYDGEERLNVTVTVNQSENCYYGPREGFPKELLAVHSVAIARDFRATPTTVISSTNDTVVGVKFTWKVPLDGISRAHLKGFYLELQKVGSGHAFCMIFDLRSLDMTASPEIHFSYTCDLEEDSDEIYRVLLLSLPPPKRNEYQQGLGERTVISVPGRSAMSSQEPAEWTTWITVKPHSTESKIEVTFGLPQNGSSARFDSYLVQLVNQSSVVQMSNFSSGMSSNGVGKLNFTDVENGNYSVQVQPNQSGNKSHCQCYKLFSKTWTLRNCMPCRTSTVGPFNFTSANEEVTSTIVTAPKVAGSGDSTVMDVSDMVAAVIVPVILVTVLLVVICIWKRRRDAQRARHDFGFNEKQAPESIEEISSLSVFPLFPQTFGTGLSTPLLTQKTVLLLASEDHTYFSQALHNFSSFLKLHCQCDVMFAPEQLADVHSTNSYVWVSSKIDTADFVIVVASEAAYRQFQAFQNSEAYKLADLGPAGDVFTLGMRDICGKIASGADVSKVIMVHFEHTSPDFRLPIPALPHCFYLLPKRLRSFLLHIHGLDESTMNLTRVNLPLQGNVEELEGGQEWLDAVEKCKTFQRQRPRWFEQKFGRAISTHLSTDSGFWEGLPRQNSSKSNPSQCAEIIPEFPAGDSCTRSSSFTKSDFIPPSVLDANSVTTATCPLYPASEIPPEIDQSCTFSEKFRMINENYEDDRRQEEEEQSCTVSDGFRIINQNYEQNCRQEDEEQQQQRRAAESVAEEVRSAISDQTDYPFSQQLSSYPAGHCEPTFHPPEDYEGVSDCVSVSSAQSV